MTAVPGTLLDKPILNQRASEPKTAQSLVLRGPAPPPLVPVRVEGVPMERQNGQGGGKVQEAASAVTQKAQDLGQKAQEAAFVKAWDNPEDEVYDRM